MSPVATIIAGIAAATAAAALYRHWGKRVRRRAARRGEPARGKNHEGRIIDFVRDPETGVFRPR